MDGANHAEESQQQEHIRLQKERSDGQYAAGPRWRDIKSNALSSYVTRWRIEEAIRRLRRADASISSAGRVLVLCAGDGYEGVVLSDLGFSDVTVSDLSEAGVETAKRADPRLKGMVLNAEESGLSPQSFDIVVIQDGLHHLPRPVLGFTEMLRIASHAVIFLEPHNSLVGRLIGTDWEVNGAAVNYVFRWTNRLVQDTASSYLGRNTFSNLSFSFWHHNPTFEKLGRFLGNGRFSIFCIRCAKVTLDHLLPGMGNQFCCLIVKKQVEDELS